MTLYFSDQMGVSGQIYAPSTLRFGAGLDAVRKKHSRTSVENRTLLISRPACDPDTVQNELSRLLFGRVIMQKIREVIFLLLC